MTFLPPPLTPRGTLLVVDDVPMNLQVLFLLLTKADYLIQQALSGQQALDLARADPPDLILMDILMPEMDGYETCAHLKADPLTRRIPVIFLSALEDPLDKVKAFHVGGADFITKPFEASEVLARIDYQLTIRRQQAELEASRQQAEAASQAKGIFLATMSHELRTPLNAIIGFSQMLEVDPSLADSHRHLLGIINRSGRHLLGLINDVLEVSKMDLGRITLQKETFDLRQLLCDLIEIFQLRARQKELELTLNCDERIPQVVQGDRVKLRQILMNLLSNAIKFTNHGSVQLGVTLGEVSQQDPAKHQIHFTVTDTGIGIHPQDWERIFEAFAQTKEGHAQDGTGLGLTLSRSYAQLMGGQITVTSTVGQGSTFVATVELAGLAVYPDSRCLMPKASAEPSYRMLVVDEDPVSRLLLQRILIWAGCEVREVDNDEAALKTWQTWHPDLIWMDLQIPQGDTMAQRIREASHLAQVSVPVIIGLTANDSDQEVDRARARGCDDIVTKPLQVSTIRNKIAEYLELPLPKLN